MMLLLAIGTGWVMGLALLVAGLAIVDVIRSGRGVVPLPTPPVVRKGETSGHQPSGPPVDWLSVIITTERGDTPPPKRSAFVPPPPPKRDRPLWPDDGLRRAESAGKE